MYSPYARTTWRYLRLGMVAVVATLGASVVIEHLKVKHGCFQTSISAYYYTPVRAVFVGALVALGMCLICLRGSTKREDLLLNLAGMFAPVVAFVPTPNYTSCTSVTAPVEKTGANIANNVVALLIVSAVVLTIVGSVVVFKRAKPAGRVAAGLAAALWVATLVVFLTARDAFVDHAHDVAAVLLFVCIVSAAVDNAADVRAEDNFKHWLYIALAAAMVVAVGTILLISRLTHWPHWNIVLETVVLSLFVIFWAVQTADLWDDGLRHPEDRDQRRQYGWGLLRPRVAPPG